VADIIVDAKVKVALVDSISDIDAPTVAELAAGTDITDQLTADGLVGFQPDTAEVDTTSLASDFDTKRPGRSNYSGTMLRFKKQVADTVYDTYVKNTETHVVIRRDGSVNTEAFAASDEVEVYPVVAGETSNMDPEPNTVQRWEMPVMVSAKPNLRATVAAS
jgi:hypothetical protein